MRLKTVSLTLRIEVKRKSDERSETKPLSFPLFYLFPFLFRFVSFTAVAENWECSVQHRLLHTS